MSSPYAACCLSLVGLSSLSAWCQREDDPESYSNFFWMRRGEGEHVYCMLVCCSGNRRKQMSAGH